MTIDTHVHIGGNIGSFEMDERDVIYSMDTYKIDKILVSNADSIECDENHLLLPPDKQVSQYNSLVRAINFARENPGRVFVAAWVKPNTQTLDKSFSDLIDRNLDIVKALKFHPFYSSLPFDDIKVRPYLDMAEKFGLSVVVHTAGDSYSACDGVFKMATEYPMVKFVMAHMGLETDHKRATELCEKLQNLYADTAWVPLDATIDFINRCGSDRLFFGSDSPIDGPDTYARNKAGQRSLYQSYFFDLPRKMNESDYENLMFRNAQRVFGM